jgi:hypothetical protein
MKIFSGPIPDFLEIIFRNRLNFHLCCRNFFQKYFHMVRKESSVKKSSQNNTLFLPDPPFSTFLKTPLFRSKNPLNPGFIQPPFPNGARIGPRFGSYDPLFDAKLLVVFAKQGVREIFTDLHDPENMDLTGLRRKTPSPTANPRHGVPQSTKYAQIEPNIIPSGAS